MYVHAHPVCSGCHLDVLHPFLLQETATHKREKEELSKLVQVSPSLSGKHC